MGGAFLLSRLGANPIDVEDDLAGALREDRWDHEAAIIEEQKYGTEKAPHSDLLCDRVRLIIWAHDKALRRARAMFIRRARAFQFQIKKRSSNSPVRQVIMPRKSPHNSCVLLPRKGYVYWKASSVAAAWQAALSRAT